MLWSPIIPSVNWFRLILSQALIFSRENQVAPDHRRISLILARKFTCKELKLEAHLIELLPSCFSFS
ncbi:hypothetical protein L3X38_043622 [Prunus dulcis]|uniref:Uncharacterized protein n=1 Tax=Prunus dulcis TaxID=3755 RepID=A0AAD4UYV6_PRUDU|nr:hypothetical protein L3X38_043622 [Prunus dulcis]